MRFEDFTQCQEVQLPQIKEDECGRVWKSELSPHLILVVQNFQTLLAPFFIAVHLPSTFCRHFQKANSGLNNLFLQSLSAKHIPGRTSTVRCQASPIAYRSDSSDLCRALAERAVVQQVVQVTKRPEVFLPVMVPEATWSCRKSSYTSYTSRRNAKENQATTVQSEV